MFYVYTYRDPRPTKNQQPVYVGKGIDKRAWRHWLHGNTRNKAFNDWLTHIRRLGLEPIISIVEEFSNEEEAHAKECELIELYGRRDTKTGPLFNLTLGGEGLSGAIRTEAWCNNISAALSTPEQSERSSRLGKARWADPVFHKTMSAKVRKAIADPVISAKREAAKLISHRTPEFKAKIGAIMKEAWQDPAYREQVATSRAITAASDSERTRKSAATKAAWAAPGAREARSEAIKASRTPELRAQIGASCKAIWDDAKRAEQSAKMKAALASPEAKAQRGAAMRARWADPIQRANLIAKISKTS